MANQITPNPSVPSQVVAQLKFPRFVNNLGIIPTSYKDSMSYYETLTWLCKFLEETVIPTLNENGEAVEELQGLYVQLNSYVTNYFDNLDIQEEINNKLDDMAEAGTLEEIIDAYLQIKALLTFNTVDDMKNSTNLISGSYARTLGYYEINDYGESIYYITENEPVSGHYEILENGNYAILVINDKLNIKQIGTTNQNFHEKIVEACNLSHNLIISEDYSFNQIITLQNINNLKIEGNNHSLTYIGDPSSVAISNIPVILFQDSENIIIDNLKINAGVNWIERPFSNASGYDEYITLRNKSYDCLIFKNCENISIKNYEGYNGVTGLFFTGSSHFNVYNSKVYNLLADGYFNSGASKYGYFENCFVENCNDNQFSCNGYSVNSDECPSFIKFNNCHSKNSFGALCSFTGSSNVGIYNSIAENIKYKPFEIGFHQFSNGGSTSYIKGENQEIVNCKITLENLIQIYGSTYNINYGGVNSSYIAKNLSIKNCEINYSGSNQLEFTYRYINGLNLENNKFSRYTNTFESCSNVNIVNNDISSQDQTSIITSNNCKIIGNKIINNQDYSSRGGSVLLIVTSPFITALNNTLLKENTLQNTNFYNASEVSNIYCNDISASSFSKFKKMKTDGIAIIPSAPETNAFISRQLYYRIDTNAIGYMS